MGSDFRFGKRTWKIVGAFSDADSARESEVLVDLDVLGQEVHFGNGFEALHVVLRPGMEQAFRDSLSTDSRLKLDAMSEHEFYARQTDFVSQLRALGMIVALILAIGAMNTMYTAVARRTSEIGVLRALGFNRINVLMSFVGESVLLAIAVEKLKTQHYDLVLMDIQMPAIDGLTATRIIREWECGSSKRHTPIVALAASALEEDVRRTLEAGVDRHVSKPVRKATLVAVIESLVLASSTVAQPPAALTVVHG